MHITRLVLDGYKRLMLSNIQYFEYTPKAHMQLIIGANGSGKSSLIAELTPVPGHHGSFIKGGRKIIECEHQGRKYVLTSHYNGGTGSHTFVCDDEVYNDAGTAAIQKELVKEHFGITRDLHDLLIGRVTFSQLSTAKRRELLTQMMPVDLTYAFNQYNRIKSLHRDQVGVIKHLTKRMALENQDLPDDGAVSQLQASIDSRISDYEKLFQQRQSDSGSEFTSVEAIQQRLQDLQKHVHRLLTTHPDIPSFIKGKDTRAILRTLEDYTKKKVEIDALKESALHTLEQMQSQAPNKDIDMDEQQVQALRQEATALEQQLGTYKQRWSSYTGDIPIVVLDIPNGLETLRAIHSNWLDLCNQFPDNTDGRMSPAKGREAKERYDQLSNQYIQLKNEQTRLAGRLAQLKGCESVVCPACDHTFRPGVDPSQIPVLEEKLENIFTQIARNEQSTQKVNEYLEAYGQYEDLVRSFRRMVSDSPHVLKPVWDWCVAERIMYTNPKSWTTRIIAWLEWMELGITLHQTQQRLEVIQNKLRYVDEIDRDAIGYHQRQQAKLTEQITALTDQQRELNERLAKIKQYREQVDLLQQQLSQAEKDIEFTVKQAANFINHQFQLDLAERSKTIQLQIAQLQDQFSKVKIRESLLADIQREHDQATQSHQELGVLVKSLSPTDGLIGRYLKGFMDNVVKMVNAVIDEIWTYPMEVLPSRVDKDELDYKFPLNVNNGAVTPADISEGSSSQVDIVDFAFKLLIMKFFHLEDYPLYLDEFGSTFDDQHRQNTIPFINRMLELGQFQQIFFISHYETTHGAFNQAEICVVDPSNITLPATYNNHVIMR